MPEHIEVPRQVWRSRSNFYRLVVTAGGPEKSVMRTRELPTGQYFVLEVRESDDALGNERWRLADVYGDQGAWRAAFHELASECGLFGGDDVTDKVRLLLGSEAAA